ncbi:hypothetical protein BaRGS_00039144 [Batillaria attramentaria]|uniref:Uncharacterized protein n=1 Tax=Batillaria attramentaria TaxID=370345 RepID=A0ABD0J449_9CAEN
MTANLLPVIVAIQIFFGVSEGLRLIECTSGCLHMVDRTTTIVTCEGFQVNELVIWQVFYTLPGSFAYTGTCNREVIGSCSPNPDGYNATVLPAGNASVLKIDLRRVPSLNSHTVKCSSACPSTTAVNTPPDTTSSTEIVHYTTTTQRLPTSSYTDITDTFPPSRTTKTSKGGETTHTTGANSSPEGGVTTTTSRSYSTATGGPVKPTDDTESNGGKQGDSGNELPVVAIAGGVGAFVVVVIIPVLIFICKRRASACDHPQPRVNQEYSPYTGLSVSRDATGQHTQHDYVDKATPEHKISSSNADNLATDGAMENTYESLQIGQDNDAYTYNSLQITYK